MTVCGEFTEVPWSEQIACIWDEKGSYFKVEVDIREGDKFKFVVNDGERYVVSSRYPKEYDNTNQHQISNAYYPNQIVWGNKEKKNPKT